MHEFTEPPRKYKRLDVSKIDCSDVGRKIMVQFKQMERFEEVNAKPTAPSFDAERYVSEYLAQFRLRR